MALTISEQYQASNEAVQKEQSRWLAYSGWNLALEQLQLSCTLEDIQMEKKPGEIHATMIPHDSILSAVAIESIGTAGVYHRTVSGIVQYFDFPFADAAEWTIQEELQQQTEKMILLLPQETFLLQNDCKYSLGITSVNGRSIQVAVKDEISVDDLYICGDLNVTGQLTANHIYVSGEIIGIENISCDRIYSAYRDTDLYQIRVLERNVG